jgi:hypothetical protein
MIGSVMIMVEANDTASYTTTHYASRIKVFSFCIQ